MNKKNIVLILIIILTIALRIPLTMTEEGLDSFHNHQIVEIVKESKYLNWNYNIFSLFGYNTLSYPSGELYYTALVSQISGLTTSLTIYIISTLIAILAIIFTYHILKNEFGLMTGIIAAFFVSISTYFIFLTSWTLSTRGLLITLIIVLIWNLTKYIEYKKFKFLLLSIIIVILMNLTHRAGILAVIILATYLIAEFIYKKYKIIFENKILLLSIPAIIILIFILQFTQLALHNPSISDYSQSKLFKGDSSIIIFLNFIINYTTGTNILIALAIVGFLSIVFTKEIKTFDITIILMMIFFSFISLDKDYVRATIIPFIAILVGIGSVFILNKTNKYNNKTRKKYMAAIMFLAILFSLYIINKNNIIDDEMSNSKLNNLDITTSKYIANNINKNQTILANNIVTERKMTMLSQIDSPVTSTIRYIDWNKIKKMESVQNIKITDRTKFYFLDWVVEDKQAYYTNRHTYLVKDLGLDNRISKKIIEYYNLVLYIRHSNFKGESNELTTSLKYNTKVYDNKKIEAYIIT